MFISVSAQLAIFLLFFGTGLIFSSLLVTIVGSNGITQVASSIITFFFPSFAFARIYEQQPMHSLGFKRPISWELYLLPVLCIVAAFPAAMYLNEINHALPVPEWMEKMESDAAKTTQQLFEQGGTTGIFVNLLVMALVPAVCEEVCFRGVIQRLAIKALSSWPGIILTSVFFAAIHLQFQGFLPRFYFSIILGAMYYYSGNIWISIVGHFVANAVQVLAVAFAPDLMSSNLSAPQVLFFSSTLVVILVLLRMKKLGVQR